MSYRIAIIGASTGQIPICKKAKEMGIETYCFAYDKGAVCKNIVDHFFPVSIFDKDEIVRLCRLYRIDGVVSNASEVTAEVVSYVAEQLDLVGVPYSTMLSLHDKYLVRKLTSEISGLNVPLFYKYEGDDAGIYPCVVKPIMGSSKKGVSYVEDSSCFNNAIEYARVDSDTDILVEQFIEGKELSVESISFKGEHYVIQITDKDSSGAPHFVELGHHQPAGISQDLWKQINCVIPKILTGIGYWNGASHIELKYNEKGIYLIEVNLRGGGDDISNKLTYLSSGVDYLRCMIEVALGIFQGPIKKGEQHYSGIYYLCSQTSDYLKFFETSNEKPWLVEKAISSYSLKESHSNYERNGYLIYKSDKKIIPYEQ